MRRSLVAMLLVVLAVPVLCGPAWARHQSSHHHYRLAWRYLPMPAENFAPGVYDYAPAFATGDNNGWRRNDWGQSDWSQNSWSRNSFNQSTPLDGMAAAQASLNGVPVSLVDRVIRRESGGNPRAQNRGNYGLMQIRLGTARAMGFSGSAAELLDPQTNMTYAVRYLAGAYRAANGNESRAVALYARGYYYQAKAQGFSPYAPEASSGFGDYYAPVYRMRHHRHRAV